MVFDIGGIDFQVKEIMPDGGVTDENTTVFYNGKAACRRRNPESLQNSYAVASLMRELEEVWLKRKESLDKLPFFTMKQLPNDSDQRVCVICLTEFEKNAIVTTFPCCNL